MGQYYRIVEGITKSDLEKKVDKLIEIGFVPIGSYKFRNEHKDMGLPFKQTMYKEPSKKDIE